MRLMLLAVLLFSASLCQAENLVRATRMFRRVYTLTPAKQESFLQKTADIAANSTTYYIESIPFNLLAASQRAALENQIRRAEAFQQMSERVAARLEEKERNLSLANNTILGKTNTASQPGTILFQGVPMAELRPNEQIIMAAAYNAGGHQLAVLDRSERNGQLLTIQELDKALPIPPPLSDKEIHRVMLAIRSEIIPGTRRTRVIDYNVDTGIIVEYTK